MRLSSSKRLLAVSALIAAAGAAYADTTPDTPPNTIGVIGSGSLSFDNDIRVILVASEPVNPSALDVTWNGPVLALGGTLAPTLDQPISGTLLTLIGVGANNNTETAGNTASPLTATLAALSQARQDRLVDGATLIRAMPANSWLLTTPEDGSSSTLYISSPDIGTSNSIYALGGGTVTFSVNPGSNATGSLSGGLTAIGGSGAGTPAGQVISLNNLRIDDIYIYNDISSTNMYVPSIPSVPEPGTWALMGLGLALTAGWRNKSMQRAA